MNRDDLCVPRHRARGIFHEPPDLIPLQALQAEDLAFADEISEGLRGLRRPSLSHRTIRDDDEHPRCANLPHQELKQQNRRAVAGEEVVQDEHQGAIRRGVLQELRDHLECIEARGIGVDRAAAIRGSPNRVARSGAKCTISAAPVATSDRNASSSYSLASARMIWAHGHRGGAPGPSQQRLHRTRTPRSIASLARRSARAVLPIPGSPTIRKRPPRPSMASCRPTKSSPSSRSRPMKLRGKGVPPDRPAPVVSRRNRPTAVRGIRPSAFGSLRSACSPASCYGMNGCAPRLNASRTEDNQLRSTGSRAP